MRAYLNVLKNYLVFSGRLSRKEYWIFILFNLFFTFIFGVIDTIFFGGHGIIVAIYNLGILLPWMAATNKRLHDTNHSGWWNLIALIPIIGSMVIFIFLIQKGTDGQNNFGMPPYIANTAILIKNT